MADGTSVGKINLEVDLTGDLNKQISEMASRLSDSLKKSLETASKGMLSGIEKTIDMAMKNINNSISQGLDNMKKQMEGFIASLQALTKKIKVPKDFGIPGNAGASRTPSIITPTTRGPPMATPKINTGIDHAAIQAEIEQVSQSIELVNRKIELQQEKLGGLKEAYERAFNPNIKNKLGTQILNTEISISKLVQASDKMGYKLADLDAKMNGTGQTASKLGASVEVATKKIKESAGKATQAITPMGKTAEVVGSKFNKMSGMINSALKRVLIMATLYKVIRGFMTHMNAALTTNQQFTNSLAAIRTNLQVAFIPIYNAILPALNAMMRGLATVTSYVASFFSILGGSSYKASLASAQALNKNKAAIAGVGAASKKAAKDIQLSLAGFDELNTLSQPNADAGGGGGGIAPLVAPEADTSIFEASLKAFLSKIDPLLEPARAALGRLATAFEPLKQNLFAGLQWFIDNILIPLGKWAITEWLPRWIDQLAGIFYVLNAAINALKPLWNWLWDNLLLPIAKWTGGIILDVMDGISAGLKKFGDWIGKNQKTVETLAVIIGSIAIAWGLVNTAIGIWAGITAFAVPIMAAISAAGGVMAAVMAAINLPIIIAVAAIAALIAIGILLWKNWDQISAWLKKTWEGIKVVAGAVWSAIVTTIKNVFNGIATWFSGVFTAAWNGIKKAFSAVGSFFQGIWNTIKSTFTTIGSVIGNGIAGAFKLVVNSIIRFAENSINGFIRAINGAISLINKIPGVNISTVRQLSIPRLATGGMIDQPTLAMVGEAGKEAVLPIDRDRGAMEQIANMLMDKMGGGSDGGDIETTAEVDGDVLFKVVMRRLNKRRRQKGLPIIEY